MEMWITPVSLHGKTEVASFVLQLLLTWNLVTKKPPLFPMAEACLGVKMISLPYNAVEISKIRPWYVRTRCCLIQPVYLFQFSVWGVHCTPETRPQKGLDISGPLPRGFCTSTVGVFYWKQKGVSEVHFSPLNMSLLHGKMLWLTPIIASFD